MFFPGNGDLGDDGVVCWNPAWMPFPYFFWGGLKGHNNFIASNNVKISTVMGLYCFWGYFWWSHHLLYLFLARLPYMLHWSPFWICLLSSGSSLLPRKKSIVHSMFLYTDNNHPASILFCPETCSYGSCKSCPVEPLCSLGAERPEKNGTFEVGKGYNPLAVYLNASFRYTNTATSLGKWR